MFVNKNKAYGIKNVLLCHNYDIRSRPVYSYIYYIKILNIFLLFHMAKFSTLHILY